MPDPSGAVAAILAVTPRTPEGEVAHEWEYDTGLRDRAVPGPPEPVAARQAAALLRWLAANCPSTNEDGGTEDGIWFDCDLRQLADEIAFGPLAVEDRRE